jgi:hypothetical protein
MNVLLFVTSFLIILALLTYAKIDSFRYSQGLEAKFESYMQTVEQAYPNKIASEWYDSTQGKEINGVRRTAEGSPRLSFAVFIDPDLRAKEQELYNNTMEWAKDLMKTLYGDKQFFQEALIQIPHFIEEILNGLTLAVNQLPSDQKQQLKNGKNVASLMNLKLDPPLDMPFYLMLKGCKREAAEKTEKEPIQINFVSFDENDPDDEEDNFQEAGEYKDENGYDSLLNYITLQNKKKVRVYLASHSLLQAITGKKSFADNIIEARTSLYQTIKNISPIPDDITIQFQSLVQGYLGQANSKFLDFTVTKTNPSLYN